MGISSRILLVVAASVLCATAQNDPPGRVGRLTYLNGDVSYRPGDVDDWVAADFNRPLTTGDHLWTDQGAQAELHVGSTALRLNSTTAFEFLNLDDSNVQVRLAQGSLSFRVRDLGDQETFEVDTPNLAFSVLRPGEYRIDVDADNQTTFVTVRGGQGEVTGGGQAFTVHPREQAQVSGGDTISFNVFAAPDPDDWDQWCFARNQREDASPSLRYVSRQMVGYQDLDDHGSWRSVPDYGAVWVPAGVAADWAPYHYGHWAWVDPWGWTWVDDAPWGFAPFHYGRWVYVGYWAWVPGPIAATPVYAPALVAWVGGASFGIAVGGGPGIAWFPLGPREVYVPSYQVSSAYINRVNVTNTTIVNNITVTNVYTNTTFVNRNAPGAVTAIPQNALASARPVQSVAVRVDARTIQSAQVITTAPIAPSRQSVLGSAQAVRAKQPPAAIQSRPVVAKRTPPPPPVPFAQKQQALSSNAGRPLAASQVQQLRSAQPAPRPLVRQAPAATRVNPVVRPAGQAPTSAPRPGGTPPPAARDQMRPPQSPSQNVPPQRPVERPAQTPPQQAQPPQRPLERPAPTPPPREAQPAQRPPEPQAQPPRPQPREAQPAQRPPEPQAQPPRPQPREAQPPARTSERPAPTQAPKQEKKDDKKKDDKDKKQ